MRKYIILLSVIIAIAALAGVCMLLFAKLREASKPETIVWDLSHGDSLEAVHWPKGLTADEFERKGRFELTIISSPSLGSKVIFHEEVQHFTLYRRNGKIDGGAIFFGGSNVSGEQAYEKLKNIMTLWQFRPKNFEDLEKWHDGIARHVSYPTFSAAHQHDRDFGQNSGLYPGFETVKAGDVSVRVSVVGGKPDDESCRCVLTLTF